MVRVVSIIELTKRQDLIIEIVKDEGPITGEKIAEKLNLTRATLRPDLAILTMAGFLEARPRVGYFYSGKSGPQLLSNLARKKVVKDYKVLPVIIKEASSVYDAVCALFLEDVGTLYVVNNKGYLAGVVSRKDLLRAMLGKQKIEDVPVNIIMTRMPNIVTCSPEDSIFDVAKKLIDYQIDSIPVVKEALDDDKSVFEVVGRVTKTTITKAYVELASGQSERS
ncbi:transcriptional regulator [Ammoniphilus oxalaticus]|uniref:Transcriptional regulator n=1 Tax=Ammoniphilus oxalaticus TaxID=66863 RepID=A0A419SJ25_9BACL|nr:helix-turn-helix transcriptional regulator [Ammoniphilus oxalaticus]RKD24013.1 transcriptional regulator [Ammoniphilus oxalaticus]